MKPSATLAGYARLRNALTRLSEARRRYERACAGAGNAAVARRLEAWARALEETSALAKEVLDHGRCGHG